MTADSNLSAATAATRIASRFRSLACVGCLLLGLLAGAQAAAQSAGNNAAPQPAEARSELVAQHENSGAVAATTSTPAQDLSLLGVIALGIIGLLWVRRHTAEH